MTALSSHSEAFKPYVRVARPLALAFLFLILAELVRNWLSPSDLDFISFWAAGRLAAEGNAAAAYDMAAHKAMQLTAASFEGLMPFPYPPVFLLLVMPFGLLPYTLGIAAWVAATFAAYLAAVRRLFPGAGWIAAGFPPVLVNGVVGQNGFVTAALFIGGLILLPRRPFAAGLVLGCLIVKPQLGLMLPIALLAGRQWRAIAGAALSSVGLLLIGLLLFGIEASRGWIGQMPFFAAIARDGLIGWHKLASINAMLRQAGVPATPALILHVAVALGAAALLWRIWRSKAGIGAKGSALVCATMLASPYLLLYDALILIVPFCWLAVRRVDERWLALLWLLPIVTIAQNYGLNGPVNLNPVVPIALFFLVWRTVSARGFKAETSPAPPPLHP